MSLSLNEVKAMARRATRGAGYEWGIAEEAAQAAAWLCAHGFDGCEALAALLEEIDGADLSTRAPQALAEDWRAAAGALCPLLAGAALSDCANHLRDGPITLCAVSQPILLAPFAASASRALEAAVTVDFEGVQAMADGETLDASAAFPPRASRVEVALGGVLSTPAPRLTRAEPSEAAWAVLNRFAARTYAPATERSRFTGAGAGLADND